MGGLAAGLPSADGADLSWIVQLASLIVLPFAHEDLAIVAGAYIINNNLMPASLVAIGIYGGIVASDFALYGLGVGARRLPFLRRYADARVRRFSETLKRNVFALVAICRFVPGVVFIAFVACGWARVPLSRFTLASLAVSAVYLPLTLLLAIYFGAALDHVAGLWTWPLLLVALVAFGVLRKRVFALSEGSAADVSAGELRAGPEGPRPVARAERIPPLLFYAPLLLSWIALGIRHRSLTLPSAANPAIPTGGMWGESKSDYFEDMALRLRDSVAAYAVFARAPAERDCGLGRALALLDEKRLRFPLVAKPDIGWHGYAVRRIDGAAALAAYLARYPVGVKLILQHFVEWPHEAAVLYARMPGEPRGRIRSLTLRQLPQVTGDGRTSLRELIRRDPRARWKAALHLGCDPTHRGLSADDLQRVPSAGETVQLALIGNQRAGGLYFDASNEITAAMQERFDEIARSMTEFHYGRFDLRFSSMDALRRGDGFRIVEINGIGGEAIDAWDPALPVWRTYRRLWQEQRLLFAIGARNRARDFSPSPTAAFLGHLLAQTRLIALYPPSQ